MATKLAIMLLTYNRFDYAEQTLRAALDNIIWNGELHVHIADDGSPDDYVQRLRSIGSGYSKVHSLGASVSTRRGYGANYNLATQHVHPWADYVLPLEDDWVLTRSLDVTSLATALYGTIGCIRLGYLGYTQELKGSFVRQGGHHFVLLDKDSAEPHVFAGHPRLETTAWERWVGPWVEGLDPNQTEFTMAKDIRARTGVAWPIDLNPNEDLFVHIGTERAR